MKGGSLFLIEETVEEAGTIRLAVTGELDLATNDALAMRLCELRSRHETVRLDLSKVEFMDARGAGILIRAIDDSRSHPWHLEIERDLTPPVASLFAVVGLERP